MSIRIKESSYIGTPLWRAMLNLQGAVEAAGLEHALLKLVKVRASQMNGCAYCIDMHTKEARAHGESEQRLYALSAWHEAPFFTPRERAALAWTEAVTRVGETRVPDEVYAAVRAEFPEQDLVTLTFAVVAINSWNRLVVSFRREAGAYRAGTPLEAR